MLVRLGICITVFGFCLYSYLNTQHFVTQLEIQIPRLEKEIGLIQEEARRLAYEVEIFESPKHLIELASRPEYSHLKHPVGKESQPEVWASN